ncbi:MAG TPA: 5'/3'-nucleotidase SurE [Azospirillaceae bacterium]|nr:5'/3'-nucleotidase SurE [Azospirillaceae bacterium]
MAAIGRVLLTNDDGIDAPGLACLAEIAAEVADEVWVVAPAEDQSGMSHSVTLHHPLRLTRRGERRFAVHGTPSDCVVMALHHLMADAPPDLILSGVNRGANLADEVAYSGTASAAMTGLLMGTRAIALSQAFRDRTHVRWETARAHAPGLIRALWADWPGGVAYNLNFPDVPPDAVAGFQASRQGGGSILAIDVEHRTDRRGQDYFWLGFRRHSSEAGLPRTADLGPDTDVGALRQGRVAVTPLRFDRTAHDLLAGLDGRLKALSIRG